MILEQLIYDDGGRIRWERLTSDEIIECCRKLSLSELSPTEIINKLGWAFGNILYRRKIMGKVCRKEEKRLWKEKSDDEVVQYSKDNGLDGLSPKELNRIDPGYYGELAKRKLVDGVCKRARKNKGFWDMTFDEFKKYGEKHGLSRICPSEAARINPTFYNNVIKKGFSNEIFVKKKYLQVKPR